MSYIQNISTFSPQLQPTRNSLTHIDGSRMIISSSKLQNINLIQPQTNQLGALYLGDIISIMKQDIIRNNKIQAILSCMYQNVSIQYFINSHKILSIRDTLQYPIINHLDQAVAWIHQQRKQKYNVLVHCHAGVSRSATIVLAYIIRTKNMNPVQALQYVRSKRARVKPNVSFWNQINDYYNYWMNSSQVQIINRPSKIEMPPQTRQSKPISVSLQPKQLQNRLSIQSNHKNDKEINKEIQKRVFEVSNQNFSPKKSIYKNDSIIKDQIENQKPGEKNQFQNTQNQSKISVVSKNEADLSKSSITKKSLKERKKIFDDKYAVSKPMKTQPTQNQQRYSLNMTQGSFRRQQQHVKQQPRPSLIYNSMPQSNIYLSRNHPVMASNIIIPSQMSNSFVLKQSLSPPQSMIIQRRPSHYNNSYVQGFPYNIQPSQNIRQQSIYHIRQNNTMSPFAVRAFYN